MANQNTKLVDKYVSNKKYLKFGDKPLARLIIDENKEHLRV